ncbi:MAG TPA: patatin-like phospholipase family protein [Solirubrobacteraceae bacterium]
MGKVVKLDASTGRVAGGPRPGKAPRRRRSKTALVLGGGGFTGGVYEIGALRALDLLSVNRTVNQFDVYVGTSAGSFVAAAVANGVTPEEMMRVIVQQVPSPFPDARIGSLLKPNYREFASRGLMFPLRLAHLVRALGRDLRQVSAMDIALALAEALPTGLYSGEGIERYVRRILSAPDRTNDFRKLSGELYLAATDLDTCERVVFGSEGWDDVPISRAVSASSALPMVYRPVRIRDREYVDGGIVSTTNLDIAVEAGAKLIVVVNPLVPYTNDFETRIPTLTGSRPRRVSDMGFPHIGYQAFKMLAHQRLHELARQWEDRYPGVDIILIEPDSSDELMFQTSVMNYTSRVDIARHGFQSVTLKLANDYPRFKRICARHGIDISATRVRTVVEHFEAERESTRAWRKILGQTTSTLLRQSVQ